MRGHANICIYIYAKSCSKERLGAFGFATTLRQWPDMLFQGMVLSWSFFSFLSFSLSLPPSLSPSLSLTSPSLPLLHYLFLPLSLFSSLSFFLSPMLSPSIFVFLSLSPCTCACVCICVCMCVCICVNMCDRMFGAFGPWSCHPLVLQCVTHFPRAGLPPPTRSLSPLLLSSRLM